MLRAWSQFPDFKSSISVHLVEMSPTFRQIQAQCLTNQPYPPIHLHESKESHKESSDSAQTNEVLGAASVIKRRSREKPSDEPKNEFSPRNVIPENLPERGRLTSRSTEDIDLEKSKKANPMEDVTLKSENGIEVTWHSRLKDVPLGPSIIIAHEFLDALPVHQFQYTELGWRERLVDIDSTDSLFHFRFVLAKDPTFASHSLLKGLENSKPKVGDSIEISMECMEVVQDIGNRVATEGGAGLLIDYGYDHASQFSLQAIKNHKFVDIFDNPGSADLSCMVDFAAMKHAAKLGKDGKTKQDVKCYGPVNQNEFLINLEIESRLAVLLQNCSDALLAQQLITAFQRLIDPSQMGSVYKAVVILPSTVKTIPPGFQ